MVPWLILAALLALALVIGAVSAAALWARPRRLALRRRVLVNLVDGKAVAGLLWSGSGGLLVLKDATVHEPGAQPMPVDGEVLIERPRVDFVQVL